MTNLLRQAWIANVNRTIESELNAQRAKWATGEDSTRQAALMVTAEWIRGLPMVSTELVVATLMEFRR